MAKDAEHTGSLTAWDNNQRCDAGAPNRKMRVGMTDGKSKDGTNMTGLPTIPMNSYIFKGGKVNQ